MSSANAFSLVSTTTREAGLNVRIALMNEEPMDPAPPMTNIFLLYIFSSNKFLLASISCKKGFVFFLLQSDK